MLSEDFDKKIREAADHHHPAYDESAWKKMQKLLDRHLPEEKRKRRGFFFLLLFLLLGGGAAWIFLGQPFGRKGDQTVAVVTTTTDVPVNTTEPANDSNTQTTAPAEEGVTGPDNTEKQKEAGEPRTVTKDLREPVPGKPQPVTGDRTKTIVTTGLSRDNRPSGVSARPNTGPAIKQGKAGNTGKKDKTVTGKNNKDKDDARPVAVSTEPKVNILPVNDTRDAAVVKTVPAEQSPVTDGSNKPVAIHGGEEKKDIKQPVPATDKAKTEDSEKKEQKPVKQPVRLSKKKSSFFFSVSGGPDVSYTGQDKMGRLKLFGGAGIGYSYRDRFVLRTGFYTARKMYTSSPEEYHAPAAFYAYYPNLQKVEADCKVYEIPVTLAYNFSGNDRHKFFVSAGLSTYLMKRETYDFYYKYNASGPVVNKKRTLYNKNDHYFSVINISAGLQQKIGKKFSIVAEPYFKVPVGGVGFAKVNLISTGLQFSVTASPFGKAGAKKPAK